MCIRDSYGIKLRDLFTWYLTHDLCSTHTKLDTTSRDSASPSVVIQFQTVYLLTSLMNYGKQETLWQIADEVRVHCSIVLSLTTDSRGLGSRVSQEPDRRAKVEGPGLHCRSVLSPPVHPLQRRHCTVVVVCTGLNGDRSLGILCYYVTMTLIIVSPSLSLP